MENHNTKNINLNTEEETFRNSCFIIDMNSKQFKELKLLGKKIRLSFYLDNYDTSYAYGYDTSFLDKTKTNPFAVIMDTDKLITLCPTLEQAKKYIDNFWQLIKESSEKIPK